MEEYQLLEKEFSKFQGVQEKQTIVCSSGTAALHLALQSLQLPKGGEVILSDYNMIACARAVVLAGLKPVFADCEIHNMLLGLEGVKKHLSNKTVAVLMTHIYGRRCPSYTITRHVKEYNRNISVIEDMAELGGEPHSEWADASCWSFYKNKIIAGEEGGCVIFHGNAEEQAHRCRMLRSMGFESNHDYYHIPYGHNYRMANSLASLVRKSLANFHHNVSKREEICSWYDDACPEAYKQPPRSIPWVYDIRIKGLDRSRQNMLVHALRISSIEARHGFKPMTDQPEFKDPQGSDRNKNAYSLAKEIVYLPIVPDVTTREDVSKSFEIIDRVMSEPNR